MSVFCHADLYPHGLKGLSPGENICVTRLISTAMHCTPAEALLCLCLYFSMPACLFTLQAGQGGQVVALSAGVLKPALAAHISVLGWTIYMQRSAAHPFPPSTQRAEC